MPGRFNTLFLASFILLLSESETDRGHDDRPDDWDDRVNSDDNLSDDSDKK